VLVALDGTEHFCSQKLGCPGCLTRKRANGRTESYHAMPGEPLGSTLAATVVAPGYDTIVDRCCAAWNWLTETPDRIRSLATTPWTKTVKA